MQQRGIDLVVQVHAPDDGRVIGDFDDEVRPAGEERVEIVATAAGSFSIDLSPGPGSIELGAYAIHVVERRTASGADRAIQESRALRATASRLERTGGFERRARCSSARCRRPRRRVGADDPYVTALVVDLAGNALEMQDNVKVARALRARDPALDAPGRRRRIRSRRWRDRGSRCSYPARGPAAEGRNAQMRQAAAADRTDARAPIIRGSCSCLVTLANLRDDAGDLEEAEAIDRRALAIVGDASTRPTRILDAELLNNLGDIYRQKGDYGQPKTLFRRSLAIGERCAAATATSSRPRCRTSASSRASARITRRRIAYYERALSIRERLVGPDHPDVGAAC